MQGYHNVSSAEARELLQPYMQTDGYYLLRPSSDAKGFCTICVTNESKLINYRLVREQDAGTYSIHGHTPFTTLKHLLAHYEITPINKEINTCLLYPVLSEQQQQTSPVKHNNVHGNQDISSTNNIPGLHLYLPKAEINAVMSNYLNTDGNYLVRPSSSSPEKLVLTVSNGGKIMNFKIVDSAGFEFYITPRRKFPSIRALLEAYKTTPIKNKVFLLYPVAVDASMQQKHRRMLEDKAAKIVPSPLRTSPQDALPLPWQRHMHEQYRKYYYYNPNTKESTWERPKPPRVKPPPTSPKPSPLMVRRMRDRADSVGKTTPTAQSNADSAPPPLPERSDLRPVRAMSMPAQQTTPTEMSVEEGPVPQLPPKPHGTRPRNGHAPKPAATPPPSKKETGSSLASVSRRDDDGWCVVATLAQTSPLTVSEEKPKLPPKPHTSKPLATPPSVTTPPRVTTSDHVTTPPPMAVTSPLHVATPPSVTTPPPVAGGANRSATPSKAPGTPPPVPTRTTPLLTSPLTTSTPPAPPPPPPPLLPPPLSPALTRPRASSLTLETDTGSGRPVSANDLLTAHKLLRKRANSTSGETKEPSSGGIAEVFSNAIDTRMMSIRKVMVNSDSESEFEDVDDDSDDDW